MFEKFNRDLLYKVNNFLYALGYFSEFIMVIFVCWIIHTNSKNLLFYIIGINISWIINRLLKPLIKDKRPSDPIKFLNSEHFVKNNTTYGMPSGHSQNVFFSLAYLYLTTKQLYPWTFVGLIIGILTIFERWYFHNHTIHQLIVGAILGSVLAYLIIFVKNKV